jgi:hypothetical protein
MYILYVCIPHKHKHAHMYVGIYVQTPNHDLPQLDTIKYNLLDPLFIFKDKSYTVNFSNNFSANQKLIEIESKILMHTFQCILFNAFTTDFTVHRSIVLFRSVEKASLIVGSLEQRNEGIHCEKTFAHSYSFAYSQQNHVHSRRHFLKKFF